MLNLMFFIKSLTDCTLNNLYECSIIMQSGNFSTLCKTLITIKEIIGNIKQEDIRRLSD